MTKLPYSDTVKFITLPVGMENFAFPRALLEITEAMRANLPDEVAAYLFDAIEERLPYTGDPNIEREMRQIHQTINLRGKLSVQPANNLRNLCSTPTFLLINQKTKRQMQPNFGNYLGWNVFLMQKII